MATSMQEIMLEFRAGKMTMEGTRVTPDIRKGLVRVAKGDEGLLHFQWLDRTTNVVEIDQIIIPDEAVFEKVQQTSGRVYILKFKEDDRKFFFWMQEPKADGDSQICNSVNYFINRPLEEADEIETSTALQMSEASDGAIGNEVSSRDTRAEASVTSNNNTSTGPVQLSDLQRILSRDTRAEASVTSNNNTYTGPVHLSDLQIILSRDTRAEASVTSNNNTSTGPVQLSDLQRILSDLGQSGVQDTGPSLGDILKPEFVVPLIEHFPLEDRLATYLPEGTWDRAEFVELLQSPQFRQQVEAFNHVLRTGQIELSQFGIDPSKYNFTVTSFLEALDDAVAENKDATQETREDSNKDVHRSP